MDYPNKDPDSVLDYGMDWSNWLPDGDIIQSSNWIMEATVNSGALTIDSDSFDDNFTVVWLSGGEDGAVYNITNRITTVQGRTQDQSVGISIRQR